MKRLANDPRSALTKFWGYPDFRYEQKQAVDAVMSGQDGLLLMQTSGGKSICYQIPALCRDGTVLVVSPLISLMKDQVDALEKIGVPATFINSSLSPSERLKREAKASEGHYKLIYLSPEKLQDTNFLGAISKIEIPFIAIDEAHCISTWGHDFRASYQRLSQAFSLLQELKGERIQRFAVTATAPPEVRQDICDSLELEDPFQLVGSFDRPNITFEVRASRSKRQDIFELLALHKGEPSLIYVATIKGGEKLVEDLQSQGYKAAIYHGRLDSNTKNQIQNDFLNNSIEIVVATSAFGMGVDKPDVRNVYHYNMPGSIENYYQEAGRGGRDGKPCRAYLLYSESERSLQTFLIDINYPPQNHLIDAASVLEVLSAEGPINLTGRELANICRETIDPKHAGSILRLLEGQGFLKIESEDSKSDHYCIEVLDKKASDLNFDFHEKRRVIVNRKLDQMEMFARTVTCRRRYLLKYFGDHQSHDYCGNCDICHAKDHKRKGIEAKIPDEVVTSVLSTIDHSKGRINLNTVRDILLGSQSQVLIRRCLDQSPGFSSLSHWSRSDVEHLLKHMEKRDLIKIDERSRTGGVLLTSLGKKALSTPGSFVLAAPAQLAGLAVHEVSGYQPTKRAETSGNSRDTTLVAHIEEWRDRAADRYGKPDYMLLSKPMIHKIADASPTTLDDLLKIGITKGRVDLFGKDLLVHLQTYNKITATNENSSTNTKGLISEELSLLPF